MAIAVETPREVVVNPANVSAVSQASVHRTPSIRLAIWLFAAFQFFYMLTSSGRVRTADEYNTLYTTQSLVLRGSTSVPQAVQLHNFYGRFDSFGRPQAAYPPGQALLSTPWYAIGQYVVSRLPGVPTSALDFVVGFSTCLSSATFSALAVALFFLLLTRIGVSPHASLFATVVLGLATPIFAYSAWFFSEPLSAAIFLAVALILFWQPGKPIALGNAAVAGLILGLAAWVRPTNAVAIVVFAAAILVRDGKPAMRAIGVLVAASAVGVVALLSRNSRLFGSAFEFGYPDPVPGTGIDNSFDTPLLTGLYGLLLSPGKSVFLFAPPVILALAGLRRLWKVERGVAATAILLPLVYLVLFAQYAHWEGGYCVGPRYLVPAIPMLCLALGTILDSGGHRMKTAAVATFVLGAAVQCLSMATSFLEDQAPARGHYYDPHWSYRMSYSLSGPVQLFLKYLSSGQPAKLGLGWDRWFVFLHNGGVSAATLVALAALMVLGLAVSLIALTKILRTALQTS